MVPHLSFSKWSHAQGLLRLLGSISTTAKDCNRWFKYHELVNAVSGAYLPGCGQEGLLTLEHAGYTRSGCPALEASLDIFIAFSSLQP